MQNFTSVNNDLYANILHFLNWCINHELCLIGLVNIDVELKDRTLNFNVSPVHAAIIIQFQSQGT